MSAKPKTVTAIRHVYFEDLGAFAEVFAGRGYAVSYLEAGVDRLDCSAARDCDILAVLGGPVGVYETNEYPFLHDEIAVIAARAKIRAPVLGICLGAQLIARALGGNVYSGGKKELGWGKVRLAADPGPLRHFSDTPVLHWHGDTFDLPAGAQLLASTDIFAQQAFSVGKEILAFQFHPEIVAAGFERWLIGHALEIATTPGITVKALRADTARFAAESVERGKKCLFDWLDRLDT
jgi:GMP synthase (glutamine-hydrolysing)